MRHRWLPELSESDLKVLDYYESRADRDGSNKKPPKRATVVRETGVSEPHVRDALARLVYFGLMRRENDGRGGDTIPNFTVLMPPPAKKGIGKLARLEMRLVRRGAPLEGGSKGAGVQTTGGPKVRGAKARAQGELDARALGGTNARALTKEDQSHYQSHDQPPDPADAGAAAAAGADAQQAVESSPPARKQRKPRVLTEAQQAMRIEFSDWWMSAAWPRFNAGSTYGFEGDRDGPAVLRLLRHPKVAWDVERAKAIGLFYLELRDAWLVHSGHPLPTLAARVNYYASKLDQRAKEGDRHVLRPALASAAGINGNGHAAGADDYAIPSRRLAPRGGAGGAGPGGGTDAARPGVVWPDARGDAVGGRAAAAG